MALVGLSVQLTGCHSRPLQAIKVNNGLPRKTDMKRYPYRKAAVVLACAVGAIGCAMSGGDQTYLAGWFALAGICYMMWAD